MKNIFRFLSKSGGTVLLIVILLIIQAYCDLALPTYTSDILSIGLQQGGIENAVCDTIRAESLESIELFLNDEETKVLENAYGPDRDGIRTLKEDADKEAVNQLLLVPESLIYQITMIESTSGMGDGTPDSSVSSDASTSDTTDETPDSSNESDAFTAPTNFSMEQIKAAIASGLMTKEQFREMLAPAYEKLESLTDTYLKQIAVYYVTAEYEAQNIDPDEVRSDYLWSVGLKMLLMTFVMVVAAILIGLLAARTSAKIGRNLRERIYTKVMSFTGAEMEHFSTASLITRSTNDIQQIQMVTVMLLRMVLYAPILAIGGIIMVIRTNSGMGWIIELAVVILAACVGTLMAVALPKFKKMQSLVDRLNLVSREFLTGIMPIRAFSREKHEEKRFERANTDLYKTQLFTNRTMTFMMPIMMLVMNGLSVLIVWVGSKGVDNGTIQIGDMTAFITYSMVIVMGFLMLSMISIMLPRAGVAADRIVEVLNTKVSLSDPASSKDDLLVAPKGILEFNDVSFRYPGADENAIEHISFTAEPGKTTAIIGSTGCGKSTLLNLIPRFYDVTEGSISLDGIDIRQFSQKKLRDQIGYVPQKGVLFSGTIESNIKYADETIPDEKMKEAASIAQATEFIEGKPETYQSNISQNGSNVSGGQKQRLSIARAIAKEPKIFLFDDSFSALDYKTDLVLRKELASKTKDATVIIVAQRISTILHADQILVLEDGQMVGKGTHEELLKSCNTYYEIASSQLSEAELNQAVKGGLNECQK